MAQLNVTELDFEDIKLNLKNYLKSQTEFSDYNFEGSGLAVLIDMLAYNTHYNGMLAHMLANENFIDTAIKRESVVSIAKALGYTPRSYLGSTATVTVTVTPPTSFTGTTLELSRNTTFTSSINGASYNFYPLESITASAQVIDGVTKFVFTDLLLKEGTRTSNQFTVEAANPQGPYIIPNENIDASTIRARVQTSLADTSLTTWNKHTTLLDVKNDSRAYWIEEGIDGLTQLRFGDGVIGQKLEVDNVVIVDYIASSGTTPNGAKTFTAAGTISSSGETVSVTTSSPASGGNIQETVDEIRFNAPRLNATRDRAVTEQDYKSLILQSNSNIQSVAVWGGEKNDPPMYGKVFISLNPVPGQIITEQDKDNIKNSIIDPKTPVAIIPEFVDPEYTYLQLEIDTTYDPKVTALTKGEIETAVKLQVDNYFNNYLNKLNKSFYYSRLHDLINAQTPAIISTNIRLGLQKREKATLNKDHNYTVKFNQKLQPRELSSTYFDIEVSGSTHKVTLQDTPGTDVVAPLYSGTGTVQAVGTDGFLQANVGTIDYDSGTVDLPALRIKKLYGTEKNLRINVTPHDSIKDITTQALIRTSDTSTAAVVAKPSRNTVLIQDDSVLNATINTSSGIKITANKEVEEI
tara:strand:- start:606 stop:2510 length:1905 start_codon:yes stop_codon:yes gene_type:complete